MYTNVVFSRINITHILALKHQLKLCNGFFKNVGFNAEPHNKCDIIQNVYDIIPNFKEICLISNVSAHNFTHIVPCRRLVFHNDLYRVNDIIIINKTDGAPKFGSISLIRNKNY